MYVTRIILTAFRHILNTFFLSSLHFVVLMYQPNRSLCTSQFPKLPIPPRGNTRALDFFEKVWSNSPLCCQFRRSNAPAVRASRASNPPSSRHVKATVETSSAKFSATRNFLFRKRLRIRGRLVEGLHKLHSVFQGV